MFAKLLLIFISIPLLEILILIKMGEAFKFWPTVFLVIVTGSIGAVIARIEGLRTWISIRNQLRAGQVPAEKMLDAFLMLAAGILLITPGLLTDLAGFFLLIPGTRFYFKRWLRKKWDNILRSSREGSPPEFKIIG